VNDSPILTPCPGHRPDLPRPGAPVWCGPCTDHLRAELATLPHLAARLQLEVENATTAGSEHVSGSKERPLHPREKYTFCIEEITGILTDWAGAVLDERGLNAALPTRPGPRIPTCTSLLLVHFNWLIAEHPYPSASEAFGLEVRRVHRRAARLTGTDNVRPERCDGVACPKCDLLMLEHEIDWQGRATGYIACAGCGSLLSAAEYGRWVKMLAVPARNRAAA
jgi:hypothetical protein